MWDSSDWMLERATFFQLLKFEVENGQFANVRVKSLFEDFWTGEGQLKSMDTFIVHRDKACR